MSLSCCPYLLNSSLSGRNPALASTISLPCWPTGVSSLTMKGEYDMKKALGYMRVSSEEQADHGLGLESQRQRIKAYCDMKGLDLVTIFEDPAVSGGRPLGTRPSGARLLAEARRTKPVVVVAKLDRLFRSVADAAQTITSFDRYGIELVAISEGFDMTNPYGRAMAQMASVFAELERAMIRERTRAAMKVKRVADSIVVMNRNAKQRESSKPFDCFKDMIQTIDPKRSAYQFRKVFSRRHDACVATFL